MTIRVLYNYLLVRLGFRLILPAEIVNNKKVRECGDKMAGVDCDSIVCADGALNYARSEVIARLCSAAKHLKEKSGQKLFIYELYRSPENQEKLRNRDREEIVQAHPEYNEAQILAALNRVSAGVGGSGHQTGGAVDLTICDANGTALDMGTRYLEHNEKTQTGYKGINEEQRRNRNLLVQVMRAAGFVNYPGEWWHFCYGDKMWAAYARKPYAIYGDAALFLSDKQV